MDFLNKAMTQIGDLFRSMTPGARITAGLLLAVVVVSLGYMFNQQVSGGDVYLLGGQGFAGAQISAMEAAFGKAGLSGYELEGNRVRIPRGQQSAYMAALVDHNALPSHFGDYMNKVLDSSNPFTPGPESEARREGAKINELNLIIRSMQGISQASVQYSVQKKTGFKRDQMATSSVAVNPTAVGGLEEQQVRAIRNLVGGAFAGLSPSSVTVVDLSTGRTWTGDQSGVLGGDASDDPYLQRLKEYQKNFESAIYQALAYVPGVTVTANVELNNELRVHEEKSAYDPKNNVPVYIREESNNSLNKSGAVGGPPGLTAQQANSSARLASPGGGNESVDERNNTETKNAPSHNLTLKDLAGLTPKRVAVSIGVPTSYFESIWRQRNPTPAGQAAAAPDKAAIELIQKEETERIRAHVANLIPKPVDPADTAAQLVTVTTFQNVVSETISGPPVSEKAITWFSNNWSTLGIIGLVLFSLLVLRSFAKSPTVNLPELPAVLPIMPPVETPAAAAAAAGEAAGGDKKSKSRFRRRLGSGPSLREELVEIVREDPDAAANILRGWIAS